MKRSTSLGLSLWNASVMAFLCAPLLVAALNSIGPGELATFPPKEFGVGAYSHIPSRWFESVATSLLVSAAATAVAIVLGTMLAFALVRGRLRYVPIIDALFRSPLQVPALVTGVAFLMLFNSVQRFVGFDLRQMGLGLVIAHTAYSIPFVFSVVLPRLMSLDVQMEEAAHGLGASDRATLVQVTLPLIAPAIAAGGFIAFFMSFDNLPLSIFLVASGVKVFPVELYAGIQFEVTRTVYAVAVLVALGSTGLVMLGYRWIKATLVDVHG